jgi:hypothetical protein
MRLINRHINIDVLHSESVTENDSQPIPWTDAIGSSGAHFAEAKTLDEIKAIRDKAEAARTYVKAAQLGLVLQNLAAEVKLRAERKVGKFLANLALRGGDRRSKAQGATLKLQDLGITRDQSRRWQHQAAVVGKGLPKLP